MGPHAIIAVCTLLLAATPNGQTSNGWLGVRVLPRSEEAELDLGGKNGKNAVRAADLDPAYVVRAVRGRWLWVTSGDVAGWLNVSDAVPLDEAVSYFSQVVAREPISGAAYGNRANAWFKLHQFDRAIEDYTQAIKHRPGIVEYFDKRGLSWLAKREYAIAIADFTDALLIDAQHAPSYDYRGVAWLRKGDFKRASEDLRESVRIDRTSAAANLHGGNAWFLRGDFRIATRYYEEAIRLAPNYPVTYVRRAASLGRLGEYHRSLEDYESALRIDPELAVAWSGRAWLRATAPDARFRDGKQAVADATQACELTHWEDADCLATLAAAYCENGDYQSAEKWQTEALRLRPDDEAFQREGKARLDLYRNGQPYRMPPPKTTL